MAFSAQDVTVAVLNFNGLKVLPEIFESITNLTSAPGEIIMVDDGSTDNSPDWVRKHCPHVNVIAFESNTKLLNRVRNRALAEARQPLVLIVDNDVTLHPDCLDSLLAGINTLPQAAVCMPRTLYSSNPGVIYQDGQTLHFVGATPGIHRDAPLNEVKDNEPKLSIGWGVQLINKAKAAQVEYFSEAYVMGWGDDGEFNHKMNMIGCFCYNIPAAIVYHKRNEASKRYYGSVKNRWRFVLETYQLKTLILAMPGFIIYEISLLLFLIYKKSFSDYATAMRDTFTNLSSILKTRQHVQSIRKVGDRELITSGSIFVYADEMTSPLLTMGYNFLNLLLESYWFLVHRFV